MSEDSAALALVAATEAALDASYTLAAIISLVGIPGAAILYGANTNKSLTLTFKIAGPLALMWGLIAYSMAFGRTISTGVIGAPTWGTINKIPTDQSFVTDPSSTWNNVYWTFAYMMLAMATITGAIGQHMHQNYFLIFITGSMLLNYTPLAHWIWNTGGWAYFQPIVDYSGGLIVHGYAGVVILVLGLISQHSRVKVDFASTQSLLAALAIYAGKQALHCSNGGLDGNWSSLGALNTIVSGYAGVATYSVLEHLLPATGQPLTGRSTTSGAVKGLLVGVVAVSGGAGYMTPMWAFLSVFITSVFTYLFDYATISVNVAGWDAFVTHGVAGFVGIAVSGLFFDNTAFDNVQTQQGSFFGNPVQLGLQCAGISVVIALTVVMTVGLYALVHIISLPFGFAPFIVEEHVAPKKEELVLEGATASA